MDRTMRQRLVIETGLVALAIVMVTSLGIVHAQDNKPIASPWAMTIDLVMDPAGAPATAGAFHSSGMLYRAGAGAGSPPVGTYHSWGWRWDPSRALGGSAATQSFEILGQGEIVVSGLQDGRSTIAGGTGNYRSVGGQADFAQLSDNIFRVTFDVTSYRSGPN